MNKIRKVRVFSIIAFFALVFLIGGGLIIKSPWSTRATVTRAVRPDGSVYYTFSGSSTAAERNLGTDTTYDNSNIAIDGVTVTISGHHDFKNLTIINNGHLQPEALTTDDLLPNETVNPNGAGANKKVDITVSGAIILDRGGTIDAIEKGLPGGTAAHPNGYGVGGGTGANVAGQLNVGAGGGGSAGAGGNGQNSNGGAAAAGPFVEGTTFDFGYGGGYVTATYGGKTASAPGAAGGGRIKIQAGAIEILDQNSYISAAGGTGKTTSNGANVYSGGGGGGTLDVIAEKIFSYRIRTGTVDNGPVVLGGINNGTPAHNGGSGYRNMFLDTFLSNLDAVGGSTSETGYAGSGGGGIVFLNSDASVKPVCRIVPTGQLGGNMTGNNIPASCENGFIVLDNAGANPVQPFYADTVQIDQSSTGRIACTDPNNPNCDSKRQFYGMILQNNAQLTHQNVTLADMANQNLNHSLADLTTGTARWKKVDIELEADLRMSRASVDVSAKGYPGGLGDATQIPSPGSGPGGGVYSYVNGHNQAGLGSGGGFGGAGGVTTVDAGRANPTTFDPVHPYFDFGSGGGGGYNADGQMRGPAGNGGGRIHLTIHGTLTVDDSDSINADGGVGDTNGQSNGRTASGGGGSGGEIWLQVANYDFFSVMGTFGNNVHGGIANRGVAANNGSYGYIGTTTILPQIIHSFGGDSGINIGSVGDRSPGGAGGGGRIVASAVSGAVSGSQVSIKKTLAAKNRDNVGAAFNPYALQVGDQIEVDLDVQNMAVGEDVTVTDDLLHLMPGSSIYCGNVTNISASIDPTSESADEGSKKVTWVFKPATDTHVALSYVCKVISP